VLAPAAPRTMRHAGERARTRASPRPPDLPAVRRPHVFSASVGFQTYHRETGRHDARDTKATRMGVATTPFHSHPLPIKANRMPTNGSLPSCSASSRGCGARCCAGPTRRVGSQGGLVVAARRDRAGAAYAAGGHLVAACAIFGLLPVFPSPWRSPARGARPDSGGPAQAVGFRQTAGPRFPPAIVAGEPLARPQRSRFTAPGESASSARRPRGDRGARDAAPGDLEAHHVRGSVAGNRPRGSMLSSGSPSDGSAVPALARAAFRSRAPRLRICVDVRLARYLG